jgi:ATP/maltotriose-dependent transcriptional regulator MalT
MASALVATKLHPPEPRSGVRRPRLTERLAGCMTAKVALVSAAPGFATTTPVGAWLSSSARPELTAWLAPDPGDNDSTRFWRYVLAALETARPQTGREAATLLESPNPEVQHAQRLLLNDLADLQRDVVLVLDDLLVIEQGEIMMASPTSLIGCRRRCIW